MRIFFFFFYFPPLRSVHFMSGPLLTLAWVDNHLRRRGLPSKYASASRACTGAIAEAQFDGPHVAPSSPTDSAPPVEELLAAVGHRQMPGGKRESVQSSEAGSRSTGVGDGGDAKSDGSLIQSQRSTPQRVASGVASFVEQQAGRTGTLNGPTQACLVLHTILTACVRHAIRYSRIDPPHDAASFVVPPSSPSAATADVTSGAVGDATLTHAETVEEVAASSQIRFPWSARVASEHLLEVIQDAAVQKGLRSFLWKVVDKEHKCIMRNAAALCLKEATLLADIGVDETEVRRLFSIPSDVLSSAREALAFSSSAGTSSVRMSWLYQQPLSLLSENHFVYTTSSPRLAALLKEGASEVKPIEQERAHAMVRVGAGVSSPDGFARQLKLLLLEMTRVRMALVLLLQFEILARRYAAFGKKQPGGMTTAFLPSSTPSSLAHELCALAIAAGSRALETSQHRKRFVTQFRVLAHKPEQRQHADSNLDDASHCSLKSVFAALSQAATANTATERVAVDGVGASSFPLSTAASSLSAPATGSEDPLEHDPVMHAVMSWKPLKVEKAADHNGATHARNSLNASSAEGSTDPPVQKKKKKKKKEQKQACAGAEPLPEEQENQGGLTWHFRCCGGELGAEFNAVDALPCGETDAKVQLLRPSIHVPWPFVLDVVAAGKKNKQNAMTISPSSLGALDTFTRPLASAAVRMRYNPAWMTGDGRITPLDAQHTTQLQRLLTLRNGRLLMMNGCPAEKLKSVMRIAEKSVRLVVRFR
ncbi:hypothetical protein MOQ_000655 [Trypanosoma cruzi marinkellei]|uniref:Uncharacterized protein n=1 Tax=Trypanosoma cruzi marinkellei TaxID=85056 RepID=K2MV96_TRYCR|nr:hypothetical protein MOQ_000655 [Trypanosoma cruzi marinkellei]